jgi:hypothetical protein
MNRSIVASILSLALMQAGSAHAQAKSYYARQELSNLVKSAPAKTRTTCSKPVAGLRNTSAASKIVASRSYVASDALAQSFCNEFKTDTFVGACQWTENGGVFLIEGAVLAAGPATQYAATCG